MALFKKADKEGKRKGLESTIGKIIYGFLLFAPLLLALTTSAYAILNKNAFESYYGETINEEIYNHIEVNKLVSGKEYYYKTELLQTSEQSTSNDFTISNFHSFIDLNIDETTVNNFILRYNQYEYPLLVIRSDTTTLKTITLTTDLANFKFTLTSMSITQNKQSSNYFYELTYNKYSYLDNNFEYGLYKAENSPLFNWAKNTGTYTVVETTCIGLGITNTFTPMLMTYWLLISIIYFIYDIALMLILILHRKIHELQDSI